MPFSLRSLVPEQLVLAWHAVEAYIWQAFYGFPGRKLVVIGVTGTKGKTTTANYLWSVLTAGGYKVGQISSANIRVGGEERLNDLHMSMPGRGAIPRLLQEMVGNGCEIAIVECTSEGMKQSRHRGIPFDIAILTNLTPEHLPSHKNSFEEYRTAKTKLFQAVSCLHARKQLRGKTVPTMNIVWNAARDGAVFAAFGADMHRTFGVEGVADCTAVEIHEGPTGVAFRVGEQVYSTRLPGVFNVLNAMPAICVAQALGTDTTSIAKGVASLAHVPGRMEYIQRAPFTVIVDYAHEKESMTAALRAARGMAQTGGRVLVLLGAEGGGRDPRKRPLMGQVAAELADIVVVANVDPYNDDPMPIIEDIARAAETHGKTREKDLLCIADRRTAIEHIISLAQPGDIVLLTGKGAEQTITIGGEALPWDDRTEAHRAIELFRNA